MCYSRIIGQAAGGVYKSGGRWRSAEEGLQDLPLIPPLHAVRATRARGTHHSQSDGLTQMNLSVGAGREEEGDETIVEFE